MMALLDHAKKLAVFDGSLINYSRIFYIGRPICKILGTGTIHKPK